MRILSSKRRDRLNKLAMAIAVALLGALLAWGASLFLVSFSQHDVQDYEPKDIQRGKQVDRAR